jgi:gamma-glutamyltranspeptidase
MTVETARSRSGIVVAGHPLAAEEGVRVLAAGGNAVDAAVAAGLVLAVVCPYACTLAGDVYMLIRDAKSGRIAGLNGTGAAPQAATRERFADGMANSGILSASVPGLLAGLADALARFGSKNFPELAATALALADEGFPVFPYFAQQIRQRADLLAQDGEASRLFLPGGAPLATGTPFRQPELAAILRLLIEDGAESFYRGAVARRVAEACAAGGGLIGAADLDAHDTLWQEPIAAPFYGHEIWTMPPNSYGPTLLLQLLALAEAGVDGMPPDSADFVLAGYRARQQAYRLAGPFVGDPRDCEAPMRALLAEANARRIEAAGQMPEEARDRCTTNVVAIDKDGNAVSLIESISAPFGAGIVLPGTGILLNNRMAGFSTKPDSRNCVAPGRRPAHTLAPCMVTKDGALVMSVGTPGTVGQTCSLAQLLARILACGEAPAAAIAAPRWSVDFAGKLVMEEEMAPALQEAVRAGEPEAKPMSRGWMSFGSVKLAVATAEGYAGFADDRRAAAARGL